MRCRAVRNRLVAYRDEELAPAEHVRVGEHLAACATCAAMDRRLNEVTPRPVIDGEQAWTEEMTHHLDAAMDEAFAHPPPIRRPAWDRLRDRLADDTRVPTGALWAYAALLLLAIGWGAHNWWTAWELQAALDDVPAWRTADTRPAGAPTTLSADQFRPAAWEPTRADQGDESGPGSGHLPHGQER